MMPSNALRTATAKEDLAPMFRKLLYQQNDIPEITYDLSSLSDDAAAAIISKLEGVAAQSHQLNSQSDVKIGEIVYMTEDIFKITQNLIEGEIYSISEAHRIARSIAGCPAEVLSIEKLTDEQGRWGIYYSLDIQEAEGVSTWLAFSRDFIRRQSNGSDR